MSHLSSEEEWGTGYRVGEWAGVALTSGKFLQIPLLFLMQRLEGGGSAALCPSKDSMGLGWGFRARVMAS